mgnify:CR=1 FL=1
MSALEWLVILALVALFVGAALVVAGVAAPS